MSTPGPAIDSGGGSGFSSFDRSEVREYSLDVKFEITENSFDQGDETLTNPEFVRSTNQREEKLKTAIGRDWNDIPITELEIVRPAGLGGSQATIKAYLEDTTGLEYFVTPYATVTVKVKVNDIWMFTGDVVKVTENEEGIVTFEAMDARRKLMANTVRMDAREEGQPASTILKDLLWKDQGAPFEKDEVVIADDVHDPIVKAGFGTDNRDSLRKVVNYLTDRMGAFTYIDAKNRVLIAPAAPRLTITPEYILSVNTGKSKSKTSKVIAEAPNVDTFLNFFGTGQTAHQSTTASASDGSNDGKEVMLKDNNVKSVSEATNRATMEKFKADFMAQSGTLEVVGNPRISPWDKIELPESTLPDKVNLAAGSYSVQQVTHKFNPQDGYISTVKLAGDMKGLFDRIHDTHGVVDQKKDDIDSYTTTQGIYGIVSRFLDKMYPKKGDSDTTTGDSN